MNEAILYLYAADVVGGLNIVSSMFFFAFVLAGGVLSCFYGATLMEASALIARALAAYRIELEEQSK